MLKRIEEDAKRHLAEIIQNIPTDLNCKKNGLSALIRLPIGKEIGYVLSSLQKAGLLEGSFEISDLMTLTTAYREKARSLWMIHDRGALSMTIGLEYDPYIDWE